MKLINFIKRLFGYRDNRPIKRTDILDKSSSWENMKNFNLKDIYNETNSK